MALMTEKLLMNCTKMAMMLWMVKHHKDLKRYAPTDLLHCSDTTMFCEFLLTKKMVH